MNLNSLVPSFPLNTVLFPGGLLPLKIFEERYLDMVKDCLRNDAPFGVCLIKDGNEVGAPAAPYAIGCLARIIDWDMPQLGVLHVKAEGLQRFRLLGHRVNSKGLLLGEIEPIASEAPTPLESKYANCAGILQAIVEGAGEQYFVKPLRFEDATWVGYRLAELLPMDLGLKQQLLEMNDGTERLCVLRELLATQGLLVR